MLDNKKYFVGTHPVTFAQVHEPFYRYEPTRDGYNLNTYKWTHVPSGKTGTSEVWTYTKADFLKLINHWNQTPDLWIYQEA